MNEGVLRKMDTALQNELARLGKRSRNGGSALGVRRIARRFAGIEKAVVDLAFEREAFDVVGPRSRERERRPIGRLADTRETGLCFAFLTFIVFGGWAGLASIDGAVIASGSVVVESDRKRSSTLKAASSRA